MYLSNPSATNRIWHTVNSFKQSKSGLNLEFSFSLTGYLTKAKESSLSYYLPISEGRRD